MREREFQQRVIEFAQLCGWRVAHFRPAQTRDGRWMTPVAADGAGFPDLVLVHHRRGVLFRELKVGAGRLTIAQRQWLREIHRAGGDADVWRPEHWPQIVATLSGNDH